MTVIIGIKEKNGDVLIGADTQASNGSYRVNRKDPKIFEQGQYVVGFTTSYRYGQIIRHQALLPEPKPGYKDYDLICEIVESIRAKTTEFGFNKVDNNQVEGGRLLIAWHGNLFKIDDDYQYSEFQDDYFAIGSGYQFALGSLCESDGSRNTYDRLRQALYAAYKFNPHVGKGNIIYKIDKDSISMEYSYD